MQGDLAGHDLVQEKNVTTITGRDVPGDWEAALAWSPSHLHPAADLEPGKVVVCPRSVSSESQ